MSGQRSNLIKALLPCFQLAVESKSLISSPQSFTCMPEVSAVVYVHVLVCVWYVSARVCMGCVCLCVCVRCLPIHVYGAIGSPQGGTGSLLMGSMSKASAIWEGSQWYCPLSEMAQFLNWSSLYSSCSQFQHRRCPTQSTWVSPGTSSIHSGTQ